MNEPTVAAVIVAFHANPERIRNLIARIVCKPLQTIYLVDNTPAGCPTVDVIDPHVRHLQLGANTGIAHAQNVGVAAALKAGHSHVVFFDQDSEPPEELVPALLEVESALIRRGYSVGAVGPSFRDRKSLVEATAVRYRWWGVQKIRAAEGVDALETDSIIASGTLVRSDVLLKTGGMLDKLFIDWVDIEWSLRAKQLGYKCFIVPALTMSHSIGDRAVRIAGRHFNLHSDLRKYFIVRNAFLLARLEYLSAASRLGILFKVLFKYVPAYLILTDDRSKLSKSLLRAAVEAVRIRRSELQPERFEGNADYEFVATGKARELSQDIE